MSSQDKVRKVWDSIVPDLVEEYFPKNECEERGKAIVLVARIYIKVLPLFSALDEGKMRKALKSINEAANQRFAWPRDSNEDSEGWLAIGKMSSEALS